MSGGRYNWMPSRESWPSWRSYGDRVPMRQHGLPRSLTLRQPPDFSDSAQDSWLMFEESLITGPLGAIRFPRQTQPSVQFLVLDSPPRFTSQRNMQLPTQENDSKLTNDEQKRVLSKLKKEIYNPSLKRLTKRLCLYYRDNARYNYDNNDKAKEIEDDGKRCAICLDDFEVREEVTNTPCNHMFHEDCIVPWLKSHGQCPVCRFMV